MKKTTGFTIVELIAVITILAIVLAITTPIIGGVIKSAKEKACVLDAGMMEKAAKSYVSVEGITIKQGETLVVPLVTLQASKFVSVIYSPEDRKTECEGYVNITNSNGTYNYKGYLKCQDVCKTAGYIGDLENSALADNPDLVDKNGAKYYVGANPKNWVKFGRLDQTDNYGLLWRIIKIDDDGIKMVYEGRENGGTQPVENGRIVIDATTGIAWDAALGNKWESPVTLKAKLNNWVNGISVLNINNYVAASNWKVGGVAYNDPTILSTFLQYEKIDSTDAGGSFKGLTTDKTIVGLINPSDFISTSSNTACTGSYREAGSGNECAYNEDGSFNNFLYKNKYHWWTMNARSDLSNKTWIINNAGQIATALTNSSIVSVRPVINIKKDLVYYAGDGSLENPYILEDYMVGLSDRPVLTMNGTTPLVIREGDSYIELGATASDPQDGDISSSILITSDLNVNVPGTYEVVYNVADSDDNKAISLTREVIVAEKDRPVLNLIGPTPQYVTLNHSYIEYGATANDLNDGDISSNVVISGVVDTTQLGTYEVKYNVTNSQNKAAIEVTRKVIVVVPKPVITLKGDRSVVVEIGDSYTEPGFTAQDEVDGDITSDVVRTIYLNNQVVTDVDGDNVGSYTITYQVTNSLGGSTTEYRYVEVVSVDGPKVTYNPDGDSYPKQQNETTVTVSANKHPVVNDSIKYLWIGSRSSVWHLKDAINKPFNSGDTLKAPAGTDYYYLWVIAKDTYNDTTMIRSKEFVIDNSKPTIHFNGSSVINLLIDHPYTDAGATAYDQYFDGNITDKIEVASDVNPSEVGTYFVTYTVTDRAGNTTVAKRRVNVNYSTPLIRLNGAKEIRLMVGTPYEDQGATATDPIDGDISSSIIASGYVDYETPGVYEIEYSVTNSFGVEVVTTRTVTIYVPKPVITPIGPSPYDLLIENDYVDEGATAYDEVDGDLTAYIETSGDVNPYVVGKYYITYSVTNSYGMTTIYKRTVNVKNPAITITLTEPKVYSMDVGEAYAEPGYTAIDEKDGDITDYVETTTNLNPNVVGTYHVTYIVQNSMGVTKSVNRTVNVIPLAGPVITLTPNGNSTYKKVYTVHVSVTENKRPVDDDSLKYLWSQSTFKPTVMDFSDSFTNNSDITSPSVTGKYYLYVLAKDTEGNTSILRSNIFMLDNTAPVITLKGLTVLEIPVDGVYSEMGATVVEKESGINSNGLVVTGTVVPGVLGVYTVTYAATDKAGNVAATVKRTVVVREIPLDGGKGYVPKYFADYFVGANPNNWLEFGQVSRFDDRPLLWRVVKSDNEGIKIIYEGVKTDNNVAPLEDGRIGLESSLSQAYDTDNANKWDNPVSLSSKLQTWYSNLYEPDKDVLVNPINWCIGGINDPYTIDDFKNGECLDQSTTGGTFKGRTASKTIIGLLNSSDYLLTSTETCNAYNQTICGTNNYLSKTYNYLTMNADAKTLTNIFEAKATGGLFSVSANTLSYVRPVINLKSGVLVLSGEGTLALPYKLNNRVPTPDTEPPVITFTPNEGSTYKPTYSVEVVASDTITGIQDGTLKYVWTTSATAPAESAITNTYSNGDKIAIPSATSGIYYLWAMARDNKNNLTIKGSGAFKLDVLAPVITMNGANPYVLEKGGVYSDEGATAVDNVDGSIPVTITSNVNPSIVGTYKVTYTATDSAGNVSIAERTVSIEIPAPLAEKIAPNLIPKNNSNYFVGANPNNWVEFGSVSSTDATPLLWRIIKSDATGIRLIYEGKKNGSLAPTANGALIANRVWDSNSNKWDEPADIRTYIENWFNNTFYLNNKDIYVNPINWCIGGVDSPYATSQECITRKPTGGTFPGTTAAAVPIAMINPSDYIAASGSSSCTNGETACGTNNFLLKAGSSYWTLNGLATSAYQVWMIYSSGVLTTSYVDTTYASYIMRPVVNLRSNVMTLRGNGSLASPYTVRPDSKPYIKLLGDNPLEVALGGTYTDPGIIASDDKDGNITSNVVVTGTVNPKVAGKYTVTYDVTDSDGNKAVSVIRTVKVLAEALLADRIAPDLITKNGSNYFVGADPKNWLQFGYVSSTDATPLLWRIIKSDSEGIKIIYEGKKNYGSTPTENGALVSNRNWDTVNNKWERPALIRTYIENWFNNTFASDYKNIYTDSINWCIGAANTPYTVGQECVTRTATGGAFVGKTSAYTAVALVSGADYISASSSSDCTTGQASCGTGGNYLYKPAYAYWTVNALATSVYQAWQIKTDGSLSVAWPDTTYLIGRPVVNLRANTMTNKGDGSLANPYMIRPNAKPSIKLTGASSINISIDSIYADAGATALDDKDGDITSRIVVTSNVNTNAIGTYTVTYNVTDSDGNAATKVVRTVNVIDNVAPAAAFTPNGSIPYVKATSPVVTVTDNPGVNNSSLKYQWTTSTTAPTEASFTLSFTNGSSISGPSGVAGSYYLWILAKDITGNTAIVSSNVFNIDGIAPVITLLGNSQVSIASGASYTDAGATATDNISGSLTSSIAVTSNLNPNVAGVYTITYNVNDGAGNAAATVSRTIIVSDSQVDQYVASKGVNKPKLVPGMTPIKWDGTTWVTTTESDDTWYSYTSTDKQWANAKTADGSMWVWIPRYVYNLDTYWHTSVVGTITVQFSMGVDDTRGNTVTLNETAGAAASNKTYTKHPGFTFGTTELTGIWVAKFEASNDGSNNIKVLPNVTPWLNQTIDTVFTEVRGMEASNVYGWGTSGTNFDTHMIKNVEWGVAAYLSKSVYGKATVPVWNNPISSFKTGCAGTSATSGSTTTCAYPYQTANGMQASTTGTIYGIYDMSGGAYEYAAAYVNNGNAVLDSSAASLVAADAKYKDIYSMGTTDTAANNYAQTINKKGDAMYETSNNSNNNNAWDGDISIMPTGAVPWFLRGGHYYLGGGSGVFGFGFNTATGSASNKITFRPVIVVGSGL